MARERPAKRARAAIEHVEPEKGDRVYAKYSNGQWYWGTVKEKFYRNGDLYYSLRYDDDEEVDDHKASDGIATEAQYYWQAQETDRQTDVTPPTTVSSTPTRALRRRRNRASAFTPEVTSSSNFLAPDRAPSSRSSTNTTFRRVVTPENTPSSGDAASNVPTPDPAPSSRAAEVRREVLTNMGTDARIKLEGEGFAITLSAEEKKKRKKCRKQWIKANTDPRTGKGRYVFKRGCAKACLTTVLGGIGTEPWPPSIKPPKVDGRPNPFIAKNEFYVAGNEAWNFFTPRFPGDTGLVNSAAFTQNPQSKQKEFHMFVQCATTKHKRHWHGEDAKSGRLYVGVYKKVVDEDGDDDVATIVHMDDPDLDITNRHAIARDSLRYYKDRYKRKNGGLDEYTAKDPRFLSCIQKAEQAAGNEEWAKTTQAQRDVLTMYQVLLAKKFTMETVPIEFVRYDEKLYQTLVDIGAVISRKGQTGRVALTPRGLHQYY